ncbi:MAG: hypothetical protein ACO1SX_27170 [Actinomycetota bacterium]
MPTATFDLTDPKHLVTPAEVRAVLLARCFAEVNVLVTPGSATAAKLARLFAGMLREARPGVWRLG